MGFNSAFKGLMENDYLLQFRAKQDFVLFKQEITEARNFSNTKTIS